MYEKSDYFRNKMKEKFLIEIIFLTKIFLFLQKGFNNFTSQKYF